MGHNARMAKPPPLPTVPATTELPDAALPGSTPPVEVTLLPEPSESLDRGWLRRSDQDAVAVLIVVGLVAMIGWWTWQGGWRGHWIEADQATPLTSRFQVDLNTAEPPELDQLPGIGPALSQRIVESREANGPFLAPADLRRVKGIGPKKMEQLRPFLRAEAVGK